jgi:hypothetical protein
MRADYPQHHALVVLLAYTGLRFCHASALHWEDWNEAGGVLRICRKQVRGKVGAVTRKKRAPKEYPVEPALAEVLRDHRVRLLKDQAPGLAKGLMFPSTVGTYRTPNSLDAAWAKCLAKAGIEKRFTIHGLRYTFTDLVRLANVDAVVRRALTGHVTEEMQRHYSTIGLDEKRAAVAGVLRLVPPSASAVGARSPIADAGTLGANVARESEGSVSANAASKGSDTLGANMASESSGAVGANAASKGSGAVGANAASADSEGAVGAMRSVASTSIADSTMTVGMPSAASADAAGTAPTSTGAARSTATRATRVGTADASAAVLVRRRTRSSAAAPTSRTRSGVRGGVSASGRTKAS